MENKQILNVEEQKFPEIPVGNAWLGDPNTVITVGTINVDELSESIRESLANNNLCSPND